jgi:hypothetical protein
MGKKGGPGLYPVHIASLIAAHSSPARPPTAATAPGQTQRPSARPAPPRFYFSPSSQLIRRTSASQFQQEGKFIGRYFLYLCGLLCFQNEGRAFDRRSRTEERFARCRSCVRAGRG